MAIFIITAALGYLGLAILGSGGFGAFFSHAPLIAVAATLMALSAAAVFTEGNLSPGIREDRGNRWVIAALGLIGLLAAYLPAYTDRAGFWTLDGEALRWAGAVLFAAGGILRLWPVFVLGRRFSGLVAIQPGHELVTSGIYRLIRHPSYLGFIVALLGWGLAFRSGVGVLLAVLTVPVLLARIRAEEALLRAHFGAAYERYCASTWRLFPGLY
ncbi:MAG TPA: isoprenylcysteine carboxylmethyltransferase family protein [Methylocella sp.]|nr:isoprenylcysteine carboxylmethyltransferase family protein [Methylocella sp.]